MIATRPIPAVAYLRRSTDRQEQSIGDQRREIARFAQENGYVLINEYLDDAISGTSAVSRPAFQQMIADARAGTFKAVLVWASDRFSRGDVTETEYYRYLLRSAGATLVSVTENYLNREGIDADVLRTVKQFQNRQFSISLSQNTLRGQISSVQAESDPGRMAPYGYDREILGPDGTTLYRVRFGEGGVREVFGKDGRLQARYTKGQSLRKPGKECKARLVPSDPERVQVVRDIFRMSVEGYGFRTIAETLNKKGIASPSGELWSFTGIKALIENPTYRGDIVWNRRTESKFYAVRGGRADTMKPSSESARVVHLPEEDWVVLRDRIPALIDRGTWDKAQAMTAQRRNKRGGAGRVTNRWLLTSVLVCGDCGHLFWGERKHKGRIPGRREVITRYYTCAGRRTHGRHVCEAPSSIKADALEKWVLQKLQAMVIADAEGVDEAVDRFVAAVLGSKAGGPDTGDLERQIKEVDTTVKAITASIDSANLSMLNDRLTQLRQRKETLERQLANARASGAKPEEESLRQWARERIGGLAEAIGGRRDLKAREVLASYVERIVVTPSTKSGVMFVNPAVGDVCGYKENDRPEGRSCAMLVAGAGSDTDSPDSWEWEELQVTVLPSDC